MDHINPKDLEAFLKAKERDAANAAISHSDGITIYQAEQDVPGVYVDSYQSATDAYNQALMQQQAITARTQQTNATIPFATRLTQFPSAMAGNPNVTVVEPTRQTVDEKGKVVIY